MYTYITLKTEDKLYKEQKSLFLKDQKVHLYSR